MLRFVDFEKMKRRIEKLIKQTKRTKTKVALQILLIQLTNGARISEAYEAYYLWVKEPSKREVQVRTRKKKKQDFRLIVVPKTIEPINVKVHLNSVKRVSSKMLGVNTHSLRYAYITFLGTRHKLPYQLISKITHHSKPELVEHYTMQLVAEEIQRKLVK